MTRTYHSKKPVMPLGILVIAIAVGIAGSLLSFVYLKINQVCPIVYLCVLCALGFGSLMGLVAYGLIKVMKIRSAFSAAVGVILGCVIFTLFKWALYVQWDYEKFYYEPAKKESAFVYYEFCVDFADCTDDTKLQELSSYSIYSDEDLELVVNAMKNMTMYDYATMTGNVEDYISEGYSEQELNGITAFDFFYKDLVKGESAGSAMEAIHNAYKMNVYEFYYEYLGKEPVADVPYLLSHPKYMWSSIKEINKVGRWSYSSRPRYSSANTNTDTDQNLINGVLLWIVWGAELLMICIPAVVIAVKRAEKPFIESEKRWAVINDSDGFMFKPPAIAQSAVQAIKADPDSLFACEHLSTRPGTAPYFKVRIYHSSNYDENYIDLLLKSYVPKNRSYTETIMIKYLYVDKDFVYKLFKESSQDIPFSYTESYSSPGVMESIDTSGAGSFDSELLPMASEMDELKLPSDEPGSSDIYKKFDQ